jgi:hypothetical protein
MIGGLVRRRSINKLRVGLLGREGVDVVECSRVRSESSDNDAPSVRRRFEGLGSRRGVVVILLFLLKSPDLGNGLVGGEDEVTAEGEADICVTQS